MKQKKRLAAIVVCMLFMIVAAMPAFAVDLVPPPATERATISLKSYDLTNPDATEPVGEIVVTGQSGDFSKVGDFYRFQAVAKEGYRFDHWEANLTNQLVDGSMRDLTDHYLAAGSNGLCYPFGEGRTLYDPNASQIQVNNIYVVDDSNCTMYYYTVTAVFRPIEAGETVSVPVSYRYKDQIIGAENLSVTLTEGEHTITPDSDEFAPFGFVCSDAGQKVTVSRGQDGCLHPQPESVVFDVVPSTDPTTITFQLKFVTRDGAVVSVVDVPFNDIGKYAFIKYTPTETGNQYIGVYTIPIPEGYKIEYVFPEYAELLYIDGRWQPVPAVQEIQVTKCAQVTVHFVLEDGTQLPDLSYQKYVHEGKNTITPTVPSGYEWVGGDPIVVDSYRDNQWNLIADPTDITFTLKKLPEEVKDPTEDPVIPSPPTDASSQLFPFLLMSVTGVLCLLVALRLKRRAA